MITGLAATTIFSEDHTRLVPFYRDVLGLPVAAEDDGEVIFGVMGEGALLLLATHSELTGPPKEPQRQIPALETTDIKGDFARLRAEGVEFLGEPEESPPVLAVTLRDPEGNLVTLLQFV